jgi:phosphoserine phosphatase RsbU/P
LTYINAGHVPPIILSNGQISRLSQGSTVLGWAENLPFVETVSLRLDSDTTAVLFTDGLSDVQNENNLEFGEDGIIEFLKKNSSLDATKFNKSLLSEIDLFRGEIPLPDDIAALVCKIFV